MHADAFEQSFAIAASGSVADDATAELEIVPILGHCPDCGSDLEPDEPVLFCPDCGAIGVEQTDCDELVLERIEFRPREGREPCALGSPAR